MMKKFVILILITLNLTNCGYAPIYSEKNVTNFEIKNLEIEGNSVVNSIIQSKLQKYFNNGSEIKYVISIKTNYEKIIATKDLTGKATNLKLVVNLSLNYTKLGLGNNEQQRVINFSESQIIKRDQNNYEQGNYENILIRNMSELLINKVILQLARS